MPVFCSIDGCNRKHNSHGYCSMHFGRLLRNGDPNLYVRRRTGEMVNNKTEYYTYNHMHRRCECENDPDFKSYGCRGIVVCKRWCGPDGFHMFLKDMVKKPSKKHSLDRINVDGGYCPENCRWAEPWIQSSNTRTRSLETRGVYFDKTRKRFIANININRIRKTKSFKTFDDAMKQRLEWEKELGLSI